MAKLNRIVSMLEEQRRELLDQLDAVDKAIAALNGADKTVTETATARPHAAAEPTASAVLPTRVKSRRVLSDEHRQALIVGNRKAREARDAAKGLARELPADSFVPAIGTRGDSQPPRLVKRSIEK